MVETAQNHLDHLWEVVENIVKPVLISVKLRPGHPRG